MARLQATRFGIAALVVFALFGGALSLIAPATAGSNSVEGEAIAAEQSVARALPKRNLNDRGVQKPRRYFIKGNVNPGWAKKNVIIQRANCKTCKFKKFAKVRTNKYGGWKFQLSAPRRGSWWWKGYVKKAGNYGKSPTNYIYKTTRV